MKAKFIMYYVALEFIQLVTNLSTLCNNVDCVWKIQFTEACSYITLTEG